MTSSNIHPTGDAHPLGEGSGDTTEPRTSTPLPRDLPSDLVAALPSTPAPERTDDAVSRLLEAGSSQEPGAGATSRLGEGAGESTVESSSSSESAPSSRLRGSSEVADLCELDDPDVAGLIAQISDRFARSPLFGPIPVSRAPQPWRAAPADIGEPLVQLPAQLCVGPVQVRQSVAERLMNAHRLLPEPLGLLVLAGHTQPGGVGACGDARPGGGSRVAEREAVTYPVFDPHRCGGAVDLTVRIAETPIRLFQAASTPDGQAADTVAPGGEVLARIVLHTLQRCGFLSDPHMPGHLSYGDQAWGEYFGEGASLYSPIG